MSTVKMSDWRRWAALDVLARPGAGYLSVQRLAMEMSVLGWERTLGHHGKWDALHRTMLSLEQRGYAERQGRPALWAATENGRELWREFIADNPNITPGVLSGDDEHARSFAAVPTVVR